MKKYDFVLLEPLYWKTPHITIDVKTLARILTAAGLKVVVINFLKNDTYHENKEYDLINIFPDAKFPDREKRITEKNKAPIFFRKIKNDLDMYKYFSAIYAATKELSDNIYLGSFTDESFSIFLLPFENKKIYFWGLRSFFLINPTFSLKRNPYNVFTSKFIRKKIFRNENIRFFISNKSIKDEFVSEGINESRLLSRPERILEKMPDLNLTELNQDFTLLTLGFIREEKNLEFSIETIKDLDIKFIIAGKSETAYGDNIDKNLESNNYKNITRKKGFIPDNEYEGLFRQSHFILFADKEQESTASNGTFLEALLKGRPVIVPDIKPFNYYVNHYGIGLMFKPEDKQSLKETIDKAKRLGIDHFKGSLENLHKDYLLKNVAEKLIAQL